MLFLFLCIYISPLRLAPLPSPLADSARLAWASWQQPASSGGLVV